MNLNQHKARIKEKLTEKEENKNTFLTQRFFWCKIF